MFAADWSNTEVHLQHGDLKQIYANNAKRKTTIFTLQHASGWNYGDNFFFFDHLNYNGDNDSDGDELYGEWYSNFSLSKLSGNSLSVGPISDIGLIAGLNFAPEVDTLYYLPGLRLSLDLPGFVFANLDITAYIQDSDLLPKEDNSYMIDFNWAYPFTIGKASFSIEGHIEYIAASDTANSGKRESWLLAQPQFRYDLGKTLMKVENKVFIGIEYQFWQNKLGDKNTDENAAQLLAVWRL